MRRPAWRGSQQMLGFFALFACCTVCSSSLLSQPVICIDPGHPSENGVGTKGKRLTELEIAWKVAKELHVLLDRAEYIVVMTKAKKGQKVTNKERAEIANEAGAFLMLRLHCDAATG